MKSASPNTYVDDAADGVRFDDGSALKNRERSVPALPPPPRVNIVDDEDLRNSILFDDASHRPLPSSDSLIESAALVESVFDE